MRFEVSAMDDLELDAARDEFRRLAVTNPKEARALFLRLAERSHVEAGKMIGGLSFPADGRARQLVASALRGHAELARYKAQLELWLENETDEFSRKATQAAIAEGSQGRKASMRMSLANEGEVYRYVSERLQHEVRNGLYAPKADLMRLKEMIPEVLDLALQSEMASAVSSIEEGIVTIGRLVEFREGDEDYFRVRPIGLSAWLGEMQKRYVYTCGPVELRLSGDAVVMASDNLLRLVFWNLWTNAHRLLKASCRIEILIRSQAKYAVISVSDNGGGFDSDQAEMIFQNNISRDAFRGRGLQEVHDAVIRLRGKARSVKDENGAFRLEISLPKG